MSQQDDFLEALTKEIEIANPLSCKFCAWRAGLDSKVQEMVDSHIAGPLSNGILYRAAKRSLGYTASQTTLNKHVRECMPGVTRGRV